MQDLHILQSTDGGTSSLTNLNHPQLAFGQVRQLDLLDGNGFASPPVECLVNCAKRAFAETLAESLYTLSVSRFVHFKTLNLGLASSIISTTTPHT